MGGQRSPHAAGTACRGIPCLASAPHRRSSSATNNPSQTSMIRALFLSLCLALVLGCAAKPKPTHLSGKVTFKGQPVPAGYIAFTPDVGKGGRGPIKVVHIKDGVYDSSKEPPDQALTPGAYLLRIDGFDGKPIPLWGQGKQIFNPVNDTYVVPDGVSTKDFTVPDSAGGNVKILRTAGSWAAKRAHVHRRRG